MNVCQVEGCDRTVSKAGHALCLDHWKAERSGKVKQCTSCQRWHDIAGPLCRACTSSAPTTPQSRGASTPEEDDSGPLLSSTRVGRHFRLSSVKVNLILAELGWIERYVKGWVPTDRGNALGANVKEMRNGTPYVVWPESILTNAALRASVAEQGGAAPPALGSASADRPDRRATPASRVSDDDFRAKYPATHRAQDGHMVRSRAEMLIDNWLYMQGIVHAYERRLPIEEECYCDFYLPKGKGAYIEFWGRESDPRYRDRQTAKRAIYAKYGLRLIELGDAEIERLDDVLPRMLLKFGIESV